METVIGNAELYEEHQPTVDALTQESLRLREELLAFAKAYAQMGVSDPEGELLKVFARDIHVAHQEFMSRLSFLADNEVRRKADAADKANAEKESASKEIDRLKEELTQVKKLLGDKEKEQAKEKERNELFRKRLKELSRAVAAKELWGMKDAMIILRQFATWYEGDCKRINDNLKKIEGSIVAIDTYKGKVQYCIDGIKTHAEEWNKILSRSRYDDVISIIQNDVPKPMVAIDEEKENLRSLSEAISKDKEEIEKKTERLKSLVKKKSEISRLIEFLNNEL